MVCRPAVLSTQSRRQMPCRSAQSSPYLRGPVCSSLAFSGGSLPRRRASRRRVRRVIEWICTAAQHRRHGIGGTLISTAVEQLGRQGADYAYAFHGANNKLSSHRLWRRSGFHPAWATWEMALAPAG